VEKDTSAVEQNPTAVKVVLCIEEEEDRNTMGFLKKLICRSNQTSRVRNKYIINYKM
jgi:hypothetical protein